MAKLIGRSAKTGQFIKSGPLKDSVPSKLASTVNSSNGKFVKSSGRTLQKGMYEILGPDGVKRTRISENVIENAIRDSARKR